MNEIALRPIAQRPDRLSAIGTLFEWDEPIGVTVRSDVPQAVASYEIVAIGAVSTDSNDDDPRTVAQAIVARAARMPGCDALEIRYVTTPEAPGRSGIRMFVTTRSSATDIADVMATAAVSAAIEALPAAYVCQPGIAEWLGSEPAFSMPILELRRIEDVTFPIWEYIPADFYYHISDVPGDGSGWGIFWQALTRAPAPVTVSILHSQTELDPLERHTVGSITSDLSVLAEARRDIDLLGYETQYPPCTNAAIALESWQTQIRRLSSPLLTRIAIRGPLDVTIPVATALAEAIAVSRRPGQVHTPMAIDAAIDEPDVRAAEASLSHLAVIPWGGPGIWKHADAPRSLRRFPYLFGLEDAASLSVLPIPDDRGATGFPLATSTSTRRTRRRLHSSPGHQIRLGETSHNGGSGVPATLGLEAVNRHVLVAGTPGTGKTVTVLSLLTQLWRDHGIPFLVIEPTKTEYRGLLGQAGFEEMRVLTLGREDIAPLRLNPLQPPSGVTMEVQANAVLAALKASLPLRDPLPELLGDAIERAYRRHGWEFDSVPEDGLGCPTLRTVLSTFGEVFAEAKYVGEARNVAAALRVRIKSLLTGSKGRIFDTAEALDFEELLSKPAILELDAIADPDDKAVLSSFLLDRVRSSARARGSTGGQLRHVTVIEEAHRLLSGSGSGRSDEATNPRAAGVEAFANAIAELRSVGEGFVLCSQSPARLSAAAVDNCSSRLLHRMESAADRSAMLDDIDANEEVRRAAPRLGVGEAIVKYPPLEEAEIIRVTPVFDVDSARRLSNDELRMRMEIHSSSARRIMPFAMCTAEMCPRGCEPHIRAAGERIARTVGHEAEEMWNEHDGRIDALQPICELLSRHSPDAQTAYCGAAHLGAYGYAFEVGRPVDIRPTVAESIRKATNG